MARGNNRTKNLVQGKYQVKNKDKYVGKSDPRYLSSWELYFFRFVDNHPGVVEWGSETTVVRYYDKRVERNRRYMVDAYMKVKDKNGHIKTYLVEIKPKNQTICPVKTSKKAQKTYNDQVETWITNQLKWQAARDYAADRNWEFIILTEDQLFSH